MTDAPGSFPSDSSDNDEIQNFLSLSNFARLFVTPFFIAAAALMLFLAFSFLFSERRTKQDYLRDIKIGSPGKRWQSAYELVKYLKAEPGEIVDDRFMEDLLDVYESSADDDPRVRRYLTLALGSLGDLRSIPHLKRATADPDEETRLYALWSLGVIGGEVTADDIISFLDDRDPGMRKLAAYLLSSFDLSVTKEALRRSLGDPVDDVTWNAALSLAKLGDSSGLTILSLMLNRDYLDRREGMSGEMKEETIRSAVLAVGDLHAEGLRKQLLNLKETDPSMKVRQAAISALKRIEGNG